MDPPAAAPLPAAWIGAGTAALTGWPDGPGLVPPAGVLARIARLGEAAGADPWSALTERAAVTGARRQGRTSCGGGTRLVRTEDGWLAASLVRPDDIAAVTAWLEIDGDPGPDPWPAVAAVAASRAAAQLVAQGALLGLPVAAVGEWSAPPPAGAIGEWSAPPPAGADEALPGRWVDLGPADRPLPPEPLVVDLSSLWAGPLCARVLASSGATVVKVESTTRPDGARRGPARFYDRLHAGQRAVALDWATAAGRAALRDLVSAADVVIEASRPRALAQAGLVPERLGSAGPALWISITGHGRTGTRAERVAFGDDAAVAGGLVAWTDGGPVFAGDAIADPLTGLAAAAAAHVGGAGAAGAAGGAGRAGQTGGFGHGGGALGGGAPGGNGRRWLVDLGLAAVASWVAGPDAGTQWTGVADPPPPPAVAAPPTPAPALGADTVAVLAALRPR